MTHLILDKQRKIRKPNGGSFPQIFGSAFEGPIQRPFMSMGAYLFAMTLCHKELGLWIKRHNYLANNSSFGKLTPPRCIGLDIFFNSTK